MEPNIVILAGGISSRMKKSLQAAGSGVDSRLLREAQEKSKAMIGVGTGSRPFLDYVLRNTEKAGYREVVIVVGERDNSIRNYYEGGGAAKFPALRISYAVQKIPAGREKPLGTADALLVALRATPGWKGKSLTVCNSDNLYSIEAIRSLMEDRHQNSLIDYDRSALKFSAERISKFAVLAKDREGFLTSIVEKPSEEEIARYRGADGRIGVSMNLFRFSYDMILPFLEAVPLHHLRQEKEIPTAVTLMVGARPRSMYTIPFSEHVIDLTSQSDIPEVKEFLSREFPEF